MNAGREDGIAWHVLTSTGADPKPSKLHRLTTTGRTRCGLDAPPEPLRLPREQADGDCRACWGPRSAGAESAPRDRTQPPNTPRSDVTTPRLTRAQLAALADVAQWRHGTTTDPTYVYPLRHWKALAEHQLVAITSSGLWSTHAIITEQGREVLDAERARAAR